jgi:cobalt-zinc-cadmium efflux system protein
MSHGHGLVRPGAQYRRRLAITLAMVLGFMVVEVVTAVLTGSLSLLSDAGHMAADGLGVAMALAAMVAADRAGTGDHRTFGLYRLEILAALANAVLLFGVAIYVLWEAARRFSDPTEVLAGPMLIVAILGLVVNLIAWRLLRPGATASLNLEGASLEVLADLVGSVGVIAAALIARFTGWPYADPLFAAAIGLFILPRAWRLGRRAVRILVQAAPEDMDVGALRINLEQIEGVVDVHDLHVWTLTTDMPVASLHLMVADGTDPHRVLDQARSLLSDRYGVSHATLQVEPDTHVGCAEVTW